jgi:AraC family transcriptional regulator
MSLTNKALWVIERNLDADLSLGGIAEACGVSRYHLAHAFGVATGASVMEYARGRRLSEAARALTAGASDILAVALEAGYASHEAFSRAFRAQFGATPEEVRRKASLDGLAMIEAMRLPVQDRAALEPPEFVPAGPLLFVGLSARISFGRAPQTIPAQWQRFMPEYGGIPDKAQPIPVGVSANLDDEGNFDFVCAAEVKRFTDTPSGLVKLTVPRQTYAVFQHRGHVSTLNQTYDATWNDWLPANGKSAIDSASLERHNPSFDPRTGNGGVTVWIPVVE